MTTLQWIVAVTVLGGVLSVFIAGLFLLVPERWRMASLPTWATLNACWRIVAAQS